MTRPRFNLVDEPWLPCLMSDGRGSDLGLGDVLVRAHEVRELFDPSPLVTVSLHRLLLAVLHRVYMGPDDLDAWAACWRKGRWDGDRIGAYLGEWRHRFDLFDGARPFYQVPSMGPAEKRHPVALLAQEVASGNNATLFDHSFDGAPLGMVPAAVARYLVARQAFSIGFGKSQPFYFADSPFLRGYSVLAFGDTLFQTLALNLVPYTEDLPFPRLGEDRPPWEQSSLPEPDAAGTPVDGYVDYLTWQSRRIHLIAEGDPPIVRFCQVRQNLKTRDDRRDPMKSYAKDPVRGWYPRGFAPDRALWRDSHTLFERAQESNRPDLFNFLARIDRLRQRGAIDARPAYSFGAFGFATDPGKAASVVLWRQERLPLPLAYLTDDGARLLTTLNDALVLAEHVGQALTNSVWLLAKLLLSPASDDPNARQPDVNDVRKLTEFLAIERHYWPRLDVAFKRILERLPDDSAEVDGELEYGAGELPRWRAEVRQAAWDAIEEVTGGLDGSGRALKAVAQARRRFAYRMWVALGDEPERAEEEVA